MKLEQDFSEALSDAIGNSVEERMFDILESFFLGEKFWYSIGTMAVCISLIAIAMDQWMKYSDRKREAEFQKELEDFRVQEAERKRERAVLFQQELDDIRRQNAA